MDLEKLFAQHFQVSKDRRSSVNRTASLHFDVSEKLHTLVCSTCLEQDCSLVEFVEAAIIYGLQSKEIFPILAHRREARRAEQKERRRISDSKLHKLGL